MAKECAKGYDKAIVLDNNFESIVKGLEKELKSDNVKYLENSYNTGVSQNDTNSSIQRVNEEIQEKIIRKIKDIL